MSGAGLFFIMASLGLPGLGNFVAEFLVLIGAFRVDVTLATLATIGILVGMPRRSMGRSAMPWARARR
jgi:NADH-quinone oxidoreductase subunit M